MSTVCPERPVELLVDARPFEMYLLAKFYHALAREKDPYRFNEFLPLGGEYMLFYDYVCKVPPLEQSFAAPSMLLHAWCCIPLWLALINLNSKGSLVGSIGRSIRLSQNYCILNFGSNM